MTNVADFHVLMPYELRHSVTGQLVASGVLDTVYQISWGETRTALYQKALREVQQKHEGKPIIVMPLAFSIGRNDLTGSV